MSHRVAIIGAGAIGGHFAARLADAGHSVTLLAMGETLKALRTHGLRYASGSEASRSIRVHAATSPSDMETPDLVIIALKAPVVPLVAPTLHPLFKDGATVIPVGNGLPWWFFLSSDQPLAGLRLHRVDPLGTTEAAVDLHQILGGSVMASCHCPEPGFVVHSAGGRVVIGEPAGGISSRASHWAGVLADAGLGAVASDDIRSELWLKLLGNACANPLSLLTGMSTDRILDEPALAQLFANMINECIVLGQKLGLTVNTDAPQRMAQTRKLGAIKTSMLQDFERGRPVELDAILGVIVECAAALKHPVPWLESVFALAGIKGEQSGLYVRSKANSTLCS